MCLFFWLNTLVIWAGIGHNIATNFDYLVKLEQGSDDEYFGIMYR